MEDQAPLPLIDGRIRLLRLLAVGGMGELYLAIAHDQEIEGLEQLVVIKRILPEFAKDPTVVTMFLIEARIAARLDHPNVVRVYDMGQANGSLYFTMEYLHGADLGRICDTIKQRGQTFPLGHVVTIILGICAGLHFAHEMRRHDGRLLGIVHRDVSPGNVFITHNGVVKLVDFGIAKVLSARQNTEVGMLKGKLAYMSPEQVRGEPVDRRSDIFAIGILLFEMVTLTHLFDGDSEYDMMHQIASGAVPPPSTRGVDVPDELERIIMTALQLRPDRRYQTAHDLAQDLHAFAVENGIRSSNPALKQFLQQLIGDHEYPWYLDEEGPDERAAVKKWFAAVPPDEFVEEVEIVDVDLDDMFAVDEEPADESQYDESQYDESQYDEPEDVEPTRVVALHPASRPHAAPSRPTPPRPTAARPRRPSRRQLAVAAAATGAAALFLAWRCSADDPQPIRSPALTTPEPVPLEPTPPASIVRIPDPPKEVTPPPPPEPAKITPKKKKPGKRASK